MGAIWGVPYLFIKVAVEHLTPVSLVFLRTVVAAVLLVPVAVARGQLRPLLPYWRPMLAFAAAEIAMPWLFLANAEQRLSSSLAGLLLAAVPLVGALLGWFTRPTGSTGGGRSDWPSASAGGRPGRPRPRRRRHVALLQMGVVAVGYAVGPFILARHLSELPGLGVMAASLALTAVAYAVAASCSCPASGRPPRRSWPCSCSPSSAPRWRSCSSSSSSTRSGPVRATVITYINPAVAVALGVIFLDEPFTVGIVVGFALVLLGSALATQPLLHPLPRTRRGRHPPLRSSGSWMIRVALTAGNHRRSGSLAALRSRPAYVMSVNAPIVDLGDVPADVMGTCSTVLPLAGGNQQPPQPAWRHGPFASPRAARLSPALTPTRCHPVYVDHLRAVAATSRRFGAGWIPFVGRAARATAGSDDPAGRFPGPDCDPPHGGDVTPDEPDYHRRDTGRTTSTRGENACDDGIFTHIAQWTMAVSPVRLPSSRVHLGQSTVVTSTFDIAA